MDFNGRTSGKALSDDGTVIAYESRGEGPPVVLVGGALCAGAADAPLAGLLAARFRVLTYDRRGRGGSGSTGEYAVEREIEDLAAVIAEAGGAAAVHGTSSGGVLALRAAAAGVPITRLSVYEPPFDPSPGAGPRAAGYGERLGEALASGRRGDALALFLAAAGMPGAQVAGLRGTAEWERLEALAHTLAYDRLVMGDRSVPACLLHEVPVLVTVVDGGASPSWLREAARLVAGALPRGRHRTLTGQTHEAAPHVLAPVLAECLAGAG
jgi:pimeloyl-ACP methyl ester carboxylesterase